MSTAPHTTIPTGVEAASVKHKYSASLPSHPVSLVHLDRMEQLKNLSGSSRAPAGQLSFPAMPQPPSLQTLTALSSQTTAPPNKDTLLAQKPSNPSGPGSISAGYTTSPSTPSDLRSAASTAPPSRGSYTHGASSSVTSVTMSDRRPRSASFLSAPRTSRWTEDKERIILAPYNYLFNHPGKDIRAQFIAAFNTWLHVPPQSLGIITSVVGMLHTASLIVDDVEDMSLLRRGVPVAHAIFGHAQTINSANHVYFLALQEVQKLNNPVAIDIFTQELLNLHRGQGMDLYWRDTLTCPNEQDYLEMVGNKTGGLFRLAIKLMQAESSSQINCIPLVDTLGILFQILDDYHNLSSATYTANKGLAEDLTEGKFSFLIIHAIRASNPTAPSPLSAKAADPYDKFTDASAVDPDKGPGAAPSAVNNILINILRQKTTDEQLKRWAIAYMRAKGSFKYARAWIDVLREKAVAEICQLESDASVPAPTPTGETGEEASSVAGEAREGKQGGTVKSQGRSGDAMRRILDSLRVNDSPADLAMEAGSDRAAGGRDVSPGYDQQQPVQGVGGGEGEGGEEEEIRETVRKRLEMIL